MDERAIELEEEMDPISEYEHLFRTLFENSTEGIIVTEPSAHGLVLEANTAAAEMHGYTVEEMRKLRGNQLHPDEVIEHVEESIKKVIEGEWLEGEHDHSRKDGSRFPIRFRAFATYYLGGRVMVSFLRDITHEKRAEEALHEAEQELSRI